MSATKFYDLVFQDDHEDLRTAFLRACTPATLFCIKRSSQRARDGVQEYVSSAFNINKHLSRHFSDVPKFRYLQKDYGVVISGSNVLEFMDRTSFPGADLDLYVTVPHLHHVLTFIASEHNMDYVYDPFPQQEPVLEDEVRAFKAGLHRPILQVSRLIYSSENQIRDTNKGNYPSDQILGVFSFISRVDETCKVQVVVCDVDPIAAVLLFHSSTSHKYLA